MRFTKLPVALYVFDDEAAKVAELVGTEYIPDDAISMVNVDLDHISMYYEDTHDTTNIWLIGHDVAFVVQMPLKDFEQLIKANEIPL